MENNKYERSELNNYSFPLLHPRELLPPFFPITLLDERHP
jgi:hypothetical protein